jgi:predicted nucleic acid-binding protein
VTFLDSSVVIEMLRGDDDVVASVHDAGEPYLTSTLCVFEVIDGKLGAGSTDVDSVRQEFGGVRALDLSEPIALEAARLQDELIADGERMAVRDLFVAATARSTGDHLFVADSDFQTDVLEDRMTVTNLSA